MPDQAQNLRDLISRKQKIRTLSVASGKGGVGKSCIAVNLAVSLSRLGMRVLVIDADYGLANVDIMLGVITKYDMSHVLKGEKTLDEIIQQGHEGVRFISGGSGVSELLEIGEEQIAGLLKRLARVNVQIDTIIMDIGAGINEKVIQTILASSETIIVTTPEPTSILDAYALVKTIFNRDDTHRIHVMMNKCENKKEALRIQEGFINVVGKHLGKSVSPLGFVMYDHEMTQSIIRQVPITVSAPDCQTSKEIEQIAKAITDIPVAKKQGGMFARFFARMIS